MKVLCVDDEPPARRKAKRYVDLHSTWEVVAEAADVNTAIQCVHDHKPDVVLLDIHLKNESGFDFLDGLPDSMRPHIVFVTAHDAYAIKAFEYHAMDYLLKPLQKDRFMTMVNRVEATNETEQQWHSLNKLKRMIDPNTSDRFLVTEHDRSWLKSKNDILYIHSEGNYIRVHFNEGQYVLRQTLQTFHNSLCPHTFQQINRSCVINTHAIQEIQTWFKGQRLIIMHNGDKLKATAAYWKQFQI